MAEWNQSDFGRDGKRLPGSEYKSHRILRKGERNFPGLQVMLSGGSEVGCANLSETNTVSHFLDMYEIMTREGWTMRVKLGDDAPQNLQVFMGFLIWLGFEKFAWMLEPARSAELFLYDRHGNLKMQAIGEQMERL